MTASVLQRVEQYASGSPTPDELESFRTLVGNQLRLGLFERLDTDIIAGNIEPKPGITDAIFLALQPRQLKFLIADARLSVVLAIQRHMTNEEYRKRLACEFHYRALRRHLSDRFRLLMVRPSNFSKYRYSEGRKPTLALAYQAEIERLEAKVLGHAGP